MSEQVKKNMMKPDETCDSAFDDTCLLKETKYDNICTNYRWGHCLLPYDQRLKGALKMGIENKNTTEVNHYDLSIVADFLEENWSSFEMRTEERRVDPDALLDFIQTISQDPHKIHGN